VFIQLLKTHSVFSKFRYRALMCVEIESVQVRVETSCCFASTKIAASFWSDLLNDCEYKHIKHIDANRRRPGLRVVWRGHFSSPCLSWESQAGTSIVHVLGAALGEKVPSPGTRCRPRKRPESGRKHPIKPFNSRSLAAHDRGSTTGTLDTEKKGHF
jgi:hypothetical protein